jgi:hypothetical protein
MKMWNRTTPIRLNDVFPDWLTGGGIFSTLQMFPVPWLEEDISGALDAEYHGNVSGDKIISPLVEKIKSGDILTETEKTTLASAIFSICQVNWIKQWETLSFEYSPIENYSMTEQMTNDRTVDEFGHTRTRTDNLQHTKTGTEQDAPDLTDTTTPNLTSTDENSVYGFNSTNPVPSDEQTKHATGTNTNTRTGTDTRTYNTTDADTGTQTDNDGGSDTRTRNYTLTRSGNIGVTTSQQMIESERALWVWNFFRDVVFPDIDRVLTLQIY